MSAGWDDDHQRDYVTLRGFEVTGPGARIRWGGNYTYLEYLLVHDVTTTADTNHSRPWRFRLRARIA